MVGYSVGRQEELSAMRVQSPDTAYPACVATWNYKVYVQRHQL